LNKLGYDDLDMKETKFIWDFGGDMSWKAVYQKIEVKMKGAILNRSWKST
jgi:hypothetical protein